MTIQARKQPRALAGLLAVLVVLTASAAARPAFGGPPGPWFPALMAPAQTAPGDEAAGDAEEDLTGLYRGVVTSRKSGKPVYGAVLLFMNEETGDVYEVTTDNRGAYEVRLPAGEYIVDIRVGRKVYRSTGSFREEASGKRWVMDFTVGSKLTEKDVRISTSPTDTRILATEPRPPLEPSRKMTEFWIFLGGLLGVAALSE